MEMGGTSNDLIYIPRDTSEMNFEQFTSSGTTFTAAAAGSGLGCVHQPGPVSFEESR